MWPAILAAGRAYAPWVVLPFAVVVGAIGYNLENVLSDKQTPWKKSAIERRQERLLQENSENPEANVDGDLNSLKNPDFVPKTIFEKNISPGLLK